MCKKLSAIALTLALIFSLFSIPVSASYNPTPNMRQDISYFKPTEYYDGLGWVEKNKQTLTNTNSKFVGADGNYLIINFIDTNKYSFIDMTTKTLMNTTGWSEIGKWNNGAVKVKLASGKYTYLRSNNTLVNATGWNAVSENIVEGFGKISTASADNFVKISDGTLISATGFTLNSAKDFSCGLALVKRTSDSKFTYITATGTDLCPSGWTNAYSFVNNYAVVKDSAGFKFINKSGTVISKQAYTEAYDFNSSLARVKLSSGNYTFMNTSGNHINATGWTSANNFSSNYAGVKLSTGKWTFINTSGNTINSTGWTSVASFDDSGYAIVTLSSGKKTLINTSGSAVNTTGYVDVLTTFKGNFAIVKVSDIRYSFVKKDGTLLYSTGWLEIFKDSDGVAFKNGYAKVKVSNDTAAGWTLVSETNGKAIDLKGWKATSYMENNLAVIQEESDALYQRLINNLGQFVVGTRWIDIYTYNESFVAGVLNGDDLYSLSNIEGKKLHSNMFKDLFAIRSTTGYDSYYYIDQNNVLGILTLSSSLIFEDGYVYGINPVANDYAAFVKDARVSLELPASQQIVVQNEAGTVVTSGRIGTGFKVLVMNNGTEVARYTSLLFGDVTGDGLISAVDVTKIRKVILGLDTLVVPYLFAGNCDRETPVTTVSSTDFVIIRKHVLGLTTINQTLDFNAPTK